jgi:hypothetical protein
MAIHIVVTNRASKVDTSRAIMEDAVCEATNRFWSGGIWCCLVAVLLMAWCVTCHWRQTSMQIKNCCVAKHTGIYVETNNCGQRMTYNISRLRKRAEQSLQQFYIIDKQISNGSACSQPMAEWRLPSPAKGIRGFIFTMVID